MLPAVPLRYELRKLRGGTTMAKRTTTDPTPVPHNDVEKLLDVRAVRSVPTSLYLPIPMHSALREVAFKEARSSHSIVLGGMRFGLNNASEKVLEATRKPLGRQGVATARALGHGTWR